MFLNYISTNLAKYRIYCSERFKKILRETQFTEITFRLRSAVLQTQSSATIDFKRKSNDQFVANGDGGKLNY